MVGKRNRFSLFWNQGRGGRNQKLDEWKKKRGRDRPLQDKKQKRNHADFERSERGGERKKNHRHEGKQEGRHSVQEKVIMT